MKITTEHQAHIKAEIAKLLAKYPEAVENYENGKFSNAEKVKDLQRRFCFDAMRGAGLTAWVCDNIYPYANDDHLYTALKAACPTVTKNF
jgi:hypothetical protein